MKPLTTILSLPVADPQATANFYADGLGLETGGVEDGIVAFELPNLSIFFIAADDYGQYLELSGQPGSQNPVAGASISPFATRAEIDEVLDRAVAAGGSADAGQEVDDSYMGYFADLDGYIWELVANEQTAKAAKAD